MKGRELERFNDLKKLLAIALKYNPNADEAPIILAKGKGHIAHKMLEIAKNEGIYVESVSEVADVLEKYNVNDYIPYEVYSIVAEILFNVMKKKNA